MNKSKTHKLVVGFGQAESLFSYHEPDRTLFYWCEYTYFNDEGEKSTDWYLKTYEEARRWVGMCIPTYTAEELLNELVPSRITSSDVAKSFPVPKITAAEGQAWDDQAEERDRAVKKFAEFANDWDTYNGWEMSDIFMDHEVWPYDLVLDIRPGKGILYYADDSDAEYWQIAVSIDNDHDTLSELIARMALHLLESGMIKGDDGQAKLI